MNGATTTLIPETIRTSGNGWIEDFKYDYDCMGNISAVWKKTDANGSYTQIARYAYDQLNQLVREDNAEANRSYAFSYDTGGNILSVSEYSYTLGDLGTPISTKNYAYSDQNWGDELTSFDNQTITYDAIGNPLSCRDGMSFSWQNGRQLASVTKNSITTNYSYNTAGTRISKTVGGVTTNYTLAGSQVVKATTGSDYVLYFYDSEGAPVFFRTVTNNVSADYYYVKNLQGDIVAICDANGVKQVNYSYDAWGNVIDIDGDLASTIGQSNPYRYRGYWFDTETGLYYLQSRYYDPQTGRFINADVYISTEQGVLGYNPFAYTLNNPISYIDTDGDFPFILAVGIIGGIIGGVSQVLSNIAYGRDLTDGLWGAVAGGFVYNIVSVYAGPIAAGYASSLTESVVNESVNYVKDKKPVTKKNLKRSWEKIKADTVQNGTDYAVGGIIGEILVPIDYKLIDKNQSLRDCFLGKDAINVWGQTATQGESVLVGRPLIRAISDFINRALAVEFVW